MCKSLLYINVLMYLLKSHENHTAILMKSNDFEIRIFQVSDPQNTIRGMTVVMNNSISNI